MPSRRQVLAAGCLALAGGAGCSRIRDAIPAETSGEAETSHPTETTSTADAAELRITVTDGDREVELVTGKHVATVGEVQESRQGDSYRVPVELTDEGTAAFADGLESVGAFEDPQSHEIRTYLDGELLYEAKLGAGLADAIETGDWEGRFLLTVTDRETAERVKAALENQ